MNAFQFLANRYGGKKAFLRYLHHALLNVLFHRYIKFSKLPDDIARVVFVCKGNICRSALAEHVFKSASEVPCSSIGLDTTTGKQANALFQVVTQATGFNLSEHRTTSLADFEAQPNDLYVCMEPGHAYAIRAKFNTERILLLGLVSNKRGGYIHDPYSANNRYAQKCTDEIAKNTKQLSTLIAHNHAR